MEQLFTSLSHAVEGAPLIALAASVAWGILSIVLSPCHLASIPLIVGFISEQGQVTARRAFWTSTLFAVGILITIAVIGVITAGGSRAEREVQVRDSAQRAAAVVMPIDFRTMRDTSDGGATILLGNGRPYRAVAQSRGSIRSMSASPVGTSGSLSHSETITVVFTAKMVLATQGPHESTRNYRRRGDALSLDRHG